MNRIEEFYNTNAELEWTRMDRHPVEFAVTLRALAANLPPPPARIVDIGGGPGRYAIELALQGYSVTLVDLSLKNLELAQLKASEFGVELAEIVHADARDLSALASEQFDAALLMGPLYHLTNPAHRRDSLLEARRLMRPGAPLVATFIGRFAPYIDACDRLSEILSFREGFEEFARDGVYIPKAGQGFVDAWFSLPEEIVPLIQSAGLEAIELRAVEGFLILIEDRLRNKEKPVFDAWVDVIYRQGTHPSLLGATEHLLGIAKKPLAPRG